ncbi:hypothetical protein ASD65_01450 [Microbacterium sp. Root61]|uniref:aldehyde dehydrogenase family protein n=1 Tax=Microbacterium sp. Root61 TaxID=1736570 RepID=UPI0006FD3E16|nr:aldehyde dehydrogenase family protein [Microbacterium sp. Root61]KRA23231.1 hypothetical protein ASD65_01450 [Microbacterium sp. Root61]
MAYASTNPFTGEVIERFDYATDAAVDAALDQAHRAFASWARTPIGERAALVARAAELMRERHEELARLATLEMGVTTAVSLMQASTVAPGILDYYATHAEEFLAPLDLGGGAKISREPMGIVFAIEPWNVPYYQAARAAAPNLVAGNVVVLKHASIVPQTSAAFESVFVDAGFPPGVFTNLYATHEQTARIIQDSRVRGVTLTGSDRAGRIVAAQAAAAVTPAVLELGGSDPMVILDDADLELALTQAMNRFRLCGQVCVSPKRIIVAETRYDEFLSRYVERCEALTVGDPFDPTVDIGPLSSESQAETVREQIAAAIAAGATAIEVGAEIPSVGAFVQPTILTNVDSASPLYGEEIFGPVPMVFSASSDEEAVRIANDTEFGLGGSVFSTDPDRAERVARRIDAGMVWINRAAGSEPRLPFGGTKASGYGTELGREGLYQFLNNKLINRP